MRLESTRRKPWKTGTLIALAGVLAAGCSGGDGDHGFPSASVSGFARLAAADPLQPETASARFEAAEPIPGVELSPELAETIQSSGEEIAATIRVMVSPEGRVAGVTTLESTPAELPLAQRFADEVGAALWGWRYRPGLQGGVPVRSFVDLTFTVRGGSED